MHRRAGSHPPASRARRLRSTAGASASPPYGSRAMRSTTPHSGTSRGCDAEISGVRTSSPRTGSGRPAAARCRTRQSARQAPPQAPRRPPGGAPRRNECPRRASARAMPARRERFGSRILRRQQAGAVVPDERVQAPHPAVRTDRRQQAPTASRSARRRRPVRGSFTRSESAESKDCSRPRGNAEFWTRVDRKMLWWPGHRQTDRFRVCSPASRRVAALRPRFRGAHGLDAGSAHAVQTCPCLTMPHSRPPRCCGRPSVQIDAVSDDR